MEPTHIEVKGARVHNLRNVSLRIPRNALVCFTGVSGSGKSSLAFDTLFAEGQRRYIESLSSYARQFLGQLEKPDCDYIGGLSPSISIQQKTAGQNPRSTVGTVTSVHDFLRVLYARVGTQHCTQCGRPISAQTREEIIAGILSGFDGRRVLLLAPVARAQKGEFRDTFADLLRAGFVRARADGQIVELRTDLALEKNKRHDIDVVIDRISVKAEVRTRLAEAVENGLRVGHGTLMVATAEDADAAPAERLFSANYSCTTCQSAYEPPTPQMFSFNSPTGMCLRCDGLGETFDFDPALLIPDDSLEFLAPCVTALRTRPGKWRAHIYEGVAKHMGFELRQPWRKLPAAAKRALLFGTGDEHITYTWRTGRGVWMHGGRFEGVIAELQDKYKKAGSALVRAYYEKYMRRGACTECRGARLNAQARAVRLTVNNWQGPGAATAPEAAPAESGRKRSEKSAPAVKTCGPAIHEFGAMSIADVMAMLDSLVLTPVQRQIAGEVLKEVRSRLSFLMDVGLHYLSLDRTAPTLSGGEAQRIRLAGQIGSGLSGVLYVLDEPSIGLHPRDNTRLLHSLLRLRDMGNTVIVVEHDEETMLAADHIVDFGPGPGVRGGEVVAEGSRDAIASAEKSMTGQYLCGKREIEVPARRRPVVKS